MHGSLDQIVNAGELPQNAADVFDLLINPDGSFISQEGVNWDFKSRWPSSLGDSYFYGIARLVCAFANTDGGLIIFGVDDKSRRATMDSTSPQPDMDAFEKAIFQLIGVELKLICRRYNFDQNKVVDVLLVQRRSQSNAPVRFQKTAHGYNKNVIWIRARHEVREAQSADISKLYFSGGGENIHLMAYSSLPPSPATVREFVGRMDCIDKIFSWLNFSDQPRHFLFGKGGSGKSTIAFEVAKALRYSSGIFRIEQSDIVDKVIFVSGKATYLNLDKLKGDKFQQNDFNTEDELYRSILTLGDFEIEEAQSNNMSYLKICLKEFFNNNSCFIVIDDIDTLTTAGVESGMDYLQGLLWRSRKRSKILYTVRNRPSHSISSSIEVPGLPEGEYEAFIDACCKQFKVQAPDTEFAKTELSEISERRPLVIESIIALRRSCLSYKNSIEVFHQSTGDDVRNYVFEREWNALSSNDKGREILAIIAIYAKPISFEDICIISRLDSSKVQDAISQIQEMFLKSDKKGEGSLYSLGTLTKKFVLHASKSLDFYRTIEARVKSFKSNFYPDSPDINAIKERFLRARTNVDYYKSYESLEILWADLLRSDRDPKVAEDPRFLAIRATCGILADHSNLGLCRKDFNAAFEMRSSPDLDLVRIWFDAEKIGDLSDVQTAQIVKYVCREKGYSDFEKSEFISRRATYLYNFARDNIGLDTVDSLEKLEESIYLHSQAFLIHLDDVDDYFRDRSWEYCRNTGFFYAQNLIRNRSAKPFVDLISKLSDRKNRLYLDPLGESVLYLFRRIVDDLSLKKDELNRVSNEFNRMRGVMFSDDLWFDKSEREFFMTEAKTLEMVISHSLKGKRGETRSWAGYSSSD